MNRREQRPSASKSRSRCYGSDVREALIVLWEASERLRSASSLAAASAAGQE